MHGFDAVLTFVPGLFRGRRMFLSDTLIGGASVALPPLRDKKQSVSFVLSDKMGLDGYAMRHALWHLLRGEDGVVGFGSGAGRPFPNGVASKINTLKSFRFSLVIENAPDMVRLRNDPFRGVFRGHKFLLCISLLFSFSFWLFVFLPFFLFLFFFFCSCSAGLLFL